MTSWNYIPNNKCESGYEEFLDLLKNDYSSDKYKQSDDEVKSEMIEDVFSIYRGVNIFPIWYYNENGIKEEIQKCIDKDFDWDGEILDFKYNQGQSLCRYLFPNMMEVNVKNSTNNSMYDRFYDDHKLKRAIKFCFDFDSNVTPIKIQAGLRLIGGWVATNFPSMKAKALYEKFCPKNGVIYDFSSGFGGRMLGAMSSKNNYSYVGVEPNTDTFNSLMILKSKIHNVIGNERTVEVIKSGSEDIFIDEKIFDFSFSSPPYFNLEKYSSEESQCYNKFPEIEEWFKGYVIPTIYYTYKMLKNDSFYAVNIADFKVGKIEVKYVDRWIKESEKIGFKFIKNIPMKLQKRRGVGHDYSGDKKEGIFLFKK